MSQRDADEATKSKINLISENDGHVKTNVKQNVKTDIKQDVKLSYLDAFKVRNISVCSFLTQIEH